MKATQPLNNDPYWYKDAIIYEIHIRAFRDSNGDGIGDFRGLTEKLDYLANLGVTAIWLLPFFPSPLRDDGYDIAEYLDVHPDYGTLRDCKEFLQAAHKKGIRVIAECVINHTSNEHAWFQRARRAKPGSRERNYYVWSDTPDKYSETRIIFKDFESSNWTWDPVANAYYWHRFYFHQPDLNFDNPAVQKEVIKIADFWFALGIDGIRLDAIPYLYEREGTNCENLPETHVFLKKLRTHIDTHFPGRMLLAEANQWPEDAVAYFGDGDECHMSFHFPLMPRLFMAVQMEESFPVIDILTTTPPIPDGCQWAMFLRNHDELTLEMVTDEERDYMYRMYAQDPKMKINLGIRRRLAPLLGNNRKKIEMMNILLFSFPGTPVIYYGDELGMGDNFYLGDRNGVRTPMQWNTGKNSGFSEANPQRLFLPLIIDPQYSFEAVNAEIQEENLSSMLWWTRRVIAIRKQYACFGRGSFDIVSSNNSKTISFIRTDTNDTILVIVNLSRFTQAASLDLSTYSGFGLEEVFSGNAFPSINKHPYNFTLGPYDHFWLKMKAQIKTGKKKSILPQMNVDNDWRDVLSSSGRSVFLSSILPAFLAKSRWFGSKSRTIRQTSILDKMVLGSDREAYLLIIEVIFREGAGEIYLLPVAFAPEHGTDRPMHDSPNSVICFITAVDTNGYLYDASIHPAVQWALLNTIKSRKKIKGLRGDLYGIPGKKFRKISGLLEENAHARILKAEQSNTSILFGNQLFMKLYRKLDTGINPECDMLRFLTEKTSFKHFPQFAGTLEYHRKKSEPITVGILQGFVENSGDAWHYTLDAVGRYYDRILEERLSIETIKIQPQSLFDDAACSDSHEVQELLGGVFADMAVLLGKRTGEMHQAMASGNDVPGFSPEPFSQLYQRSLYQSMHSMVTKTMQSLRKNLSTVPESLRSEAKTVLSLQEDIIALMRKFTKTKITAMKIRIHGDYHLGQVLFTGKNFVIIDFEGEPARTLHERKLLYSCFRDIAGMLRSFHYAAHGALFLNKSFRPEDIELLERWVDPWYITISRLFLNSYFSTVGTESFVPQKQDQQETLLNLFLLEKSVYELGYELNNRPSWMIIPLKGIKSIIAHTSKKEGRS